MAKVKENQAKPRKKNGCIVTKWVFCCRPNCSQCPHGPYAYHVTKHKGKQVWHYLGRADWTFTFSASQLISWLFGKTLETVLSIAFLVQALGPPASFVAQEVLHNSLGFIRVHCDVLLWFRLALDDSLGFTAHHYGFILLTFCWNLLSFLVFYFV